MTAFSKVQKSNVLLTLESWNSICFVMVQLVQCPCQVLNFCFSSLTLWDLLQGISTIGHKQVLLFFCFSSKALSLLHKRLTPASSHRQYSVSVFCKCFKGTETTVRATVTSRIYNYRGINLSVSFLAMLIWNSFFDNLSHAFCCRCE